MNWSKVFDVLKAVYNAFLKGKTVKIGGTDVTLPSQGNTVYPPGQSPLDSTPHKPEPPLQFPGGRL